MNRKYRGVLATLWTIFISILFCLPGSALPKADWLSKIYFDKWVHIGFFMVLVILWSWFLDIKRNRIYLTIIIVSILYGLTVELVQHYLIVNRSFDLGDLLADTVGALVGLFVWKGYIKK
ncbi:MAG TPA: VanZ family protein [Chitinophagaceae bacterium]|nr:VanZ family protein [Chitinophagaceae bacterium]